MKYHILCFLDKSYPPNHSFVDDFLASALPNDNVNVTLYVSKSDKFIKCHKYKNAQICPILFPRRNFLRFLNYFKVYKILEKILNSQTSTKKWIILITNEPIFLYAAHRIKRKNHYPLVFQQSFPHEKSGKNFIKKIVAIILMKKSASSIDLLLGVTKQSITRIKKLLMIDIPDLVIPLGINPEIHKNIQNHLLNSFPKFVYVGSHSKERKIDIIIKAIIEMQKHNDLFKHSFNFYGASRKQVKKFKKIKGVKNLIEKQVLVFHNKINRRELINILPKYDVGLSLIPSKKIYEESFPTKLSEYMFAGLAVLASNTVLSQNNVIKDANSGWLTEFDIESIHNKLNEIYNSTSIHQFKVNSRRFVEKKLDYNLYAKEFIFFVQNLG